MHALTLDEGFQVHLAVDGRHDWRLTRGRLCTAARVESAALEWWQSNGSVSTYSPSYSDSASTQPADQNVLIVKLTESTQTKCAVDRKASVMTAPHLTRCLTEPGTVSGQSL